MPGSLRNDFGPRRSGIPWPFGRPLLELEASPRGREAEGNSEWRARGAIRVSPRARGRAILILRRALLCSLFGWSSGCAAIDPILVQDKAWVWLGASFVLAVAIVGAERRLAWYRAWKNWNLAKDLETPKMRIPSILVIAVASAFAVYNFFGNPLPSPPEQKWQNLIAWVIGSGLGMVGGFLGGKKLAATQYKRVYARQPSSKAVSGRE